MWEKKWNLQVSREKDKLLKRKKDQTVNMTSYMQSGNFREIYYMQNVEKKCNIKNFIPSHDVINFSG